MKICPNCGFQGQNNDYFCENCGVNIQKVKPVNNGPANNNPFNNNPVNNYPFNNNPANNYPFNNDPGNDETGNNKLVSTLLILLGVVLGLGIVFVMIKYLMPMIKTDNSAQQAQEEVIQEEPMKEEPAQEAQGEPVQEEPVQEEPVQEAQAKEEPFVPLDPPDRYYYFGGHTYAFYNTDTYNLESYEEVAEFCRRQKGHLATIETSEENKYLFRTVEQNFQLTAFFGYNDIENEGEWVWTDGESDYSNFTYNSEQQQPDNGVHYGTEEDIAEFNYERNTDSVNDGTWNDAPFIHNTTRFICEWDFEI